MSLIASPTGFGQAPDLSRATKATHETAATAPKTNAPERTVRYSAPATISRYTRLNVVSLFPAFDSVAVAG